MKKTTLHFLYFISCFLYFSGCRVVEEDGSSNNSQYKNDIQSSPPKKSEKEKENKKSALTKDETPPISKNNTANTEAKVEVAKKNVDKNTSIKVEVPKKPVATKTAKVEVKKEGENNKPLSSKISDNKLAESSPKVEILNKAVTESLPKEVEVPKPLECKHVQQDDDKEGENNKPLSSKTSNNKPAETSPKVEILNKAVTESLPKEVAKPLENKHVQQDDVKEDDPKTIILKNDHISIKRIVKSIIDENIIYEIKKSSPIPLFIDDKGNTIPNGDIDSLTKEQMITTSYLLLPKEDWFVKHYEDNPFVGIDGFTLPRPSIAGFEMQKVEESSDAILYKKLELIEPPTVREILKLEKSFKTAFTNQLGEGGQGLVFLLAFNHKEYALKRHKQSEAVDQWYQLELVQFTNAAVKLYASFIYNNEFYYIMEKGKSLDKIIENNEKIDENIILASTKKIQLLHKTFKDFNIINNDIKPGNMILVNGRIKIIDPYNSYTDVSYKGSPPQRMVKVLVESYKGQYFVFVKHLLEEYFKKDCQMDFFSKKGISLCEGTIRHWLQMVCKELSLGIDCSLITNFEELYANLTQEDFIQLFDKTNCPQKISSFLPQPYPHLLKRDEIQWSFYFNKLDELKERFLRNCSKLDSTFYKSIADKYLPYFSKNNEELVAFNIKFDDENDSKFQEWIIDFYTPYFKDRVWKNLLALFGATIDPFPALMKEKLESMNSELYKELIKLYNL